MYRIFAAKTRAFSLIPLYAALALTPFSAQAEQPPKGHAALKNLVVIGDSLSAGFQNFSLFTSANGGQTFGFAAVVAQQAGVNLSLPTISFPGIPPALELSAGQIVREAGLGSRTNLAQATNLSVPGFTVGNVLAYPFPGNPTVNTIDALSDTVLGTPQHFPCGPIPTFLVSWLPLPSSISSLVPAGSPYFVSETACALALEPTTIMVSIGSNDVLQALTLGATPTSPAIFQQNYSLMLDGLVLSGANIVVANVPDVTELPFLVTPAAFAQLCPGKSLPAGTYVVPNLGAPTFNICTENIPVTQAQVLGIQALVLQYNAIIRSQVVALKAHGVSVTLVDINSVLKTLYISGYTLPNNFKLTTAFLGGLFSLDGIHPTNTGYAILANAFITAMNGALDTSIPLANIPLVASKDPLIF